jgi:enolase
MAIRVDVGEAGVGAGNTLAIKVTVAKAAAVTLLKPVNPLFSFIGGGELRTGGGGAGAYG